MKRNPDGTINFGSDPVVSDLLAEQERKQAERALTPGKRAKRAADRARVRMYLDVSPEIKRELEELGAELGVPVSSVAALLLARGLAGVDVEELRALRVPSRSMRYEYLIPLEAKKGKKK